MKLQGASILDLVTELLIRLDAQGKLEQLPQPITLVAILEETGHDPVIAFTRILGDERFAKMQAGPVAPKARR
jgi:hypothetical protein